VVEYGERFLFHLVEIDLDYARFKPLPLQLNQATQWNRFRIELQCWTCLPVSGRSERHDAHGNCGDDEPEHVERLSQTGLQDVRFMAYGVSVWRRRAEFERAENVDRIPEENSETAVLALDDQSDVGLHGSITRSAEWQALQLHRVIVRDDHESAVVGHVTKQ
jgi:hypothetical protein